MRKVLIFPVILILAAFSCRNGPINPGASQTRGRVPVTVTRVIIDTLQETVGLNAVSAYLLKTYIKANADGYLLEVNATLGEKIEKGKKMFVIRTKEAEFLGDALNSLDSTLRFSGLINIKSPGSGYVTQLDYRPGDYVQDGETLAAVSDEKSLVFMLELPYELRPLLPGNKTVRLTLPDERIVTGTVSQSMPAVDPVSQTQSYIISIPPGLSIPENLIAKVNFIKRSKPGAVTLPKDAVLTNEVQDEFWIMKMIDDSTAVKMPVIKGMESSGKVEILSPALTPSDIILLTGNYGLPDTAEVEIKTGR
jgi:multidrug efflux pump subunit AcrA (membrane-fusion protein)